MKIEQELIKSVASQLIFTLQPSGADFLLNVRIQRAYENIAADHPLGLLHIINYYKSRPCDLLFFKYASYVLSPILRI